MVKWMRPKQESPAYCGGAGAYRKKPNKRLVIGPD